MTMFSTGCRRGAAGGKGPTRTADALQGYLAETKLRPSRTLQKDYAWDLMVFLGRGLFLMQEVPLYRMWRRYSGRGDWQVGGSGAGGRATTPRRASTRSPLLYTRHTKYTRRINYTRTAKYTRHTEYSRHTEYTRLNEYTRHIKYNRHTKTHIRSAKCKTRNERPET